MKIKPILIGATGVLLLAGIFFYVRSKNSVRPEKAEINQFLNGFNNRINEGNTDSLLAYFDADRKFKTLKRLVNLLEGYKTIDGKEKPVLKLSLNVDASEIKIVSSELVIANIPAKFSHDSLESKSSILTIKIRKVAPHRFKIIQVDARKFLTDYVAYENYVRSKTLSEKDLFSPITLAAFKSAEQLKTRYDSVVWFAHLDNKTFYYVVKGKWDMDKDINRYKDSVIEPYQMGLVNPELKEIIPAEFDLIHNIGGTFPGLVEVEKENKRGFYDLGGKVIVPVVYDQIFPIEDDANLAVLRNGSDYFYLKKDMGISEKVNVKIADIFSKIKNIGNHFDLYGSAISVVTEYNSRQENGAVYIPPTYMTDLNMIEKLKDFKNPLRKINNEDGDAEGGTHESYDISFAGKGLQRESWLETSFYSIKDYFLGGRSGFYDKKNVVILDKKNDRLLSQNIDTDYGPMGNGSLEGECDVNSLKIINDSLFEVKAGALLFVQLYDSTKTISGGPYYHYLAIRNNKLVELPNNRSFGFTKYVKMDDSYLNACYIIDADGQKSQTIDHVTPEMLRYIKNEIFADYGYQFKDKRWEGAFADMASYFGNRNHDKPNNVSVDDSLTAIDKYNINWINQKLKGTHAKSNAVAFK